MAAVVQLVLGNRRRKEKEKEEREKKLAENGDVEEGMEKRQTIKGLQKPPSSAGDRAFLYEKNAVTMAAHEGAVEEPLKIMKDKWVERLVLENAMETDIARCFLFLAFFMVFLFMLWMSYPAGSLLPVHQALVGHFNLEEAEDSNVDNVARGAGSPNAFVDNLGDLKDYLQNMAFDAREFSPGSNKYVADHFARSYLAEEMDFYDKKYKLPSDHVPKLTKDFTVMVWIKTKVQFGTILEKKEDTKVCWRFEMEKLYYGEHESPVGLTVPNPLARTIGTNWQASEFRQKLQDGNWHHFAVSVTGGNTRNVTFFHDGIPQTPVPLVRGRPVTDCDLGDVYIGDAMLGTFVDMKFYPRKLEKMEVDEVINGGKTLDDLLAGNGALVTEDRPLSKLITWTHDVEQKMSVDRDDVKTHVDDKITKFSKFVLQAHQTTKTDVKQDITNTKEDVIAAIPTPAPAAGPLPPRRRVEEVGTSEQKGKSPSQKMSTSNLDTRRATGAQPDGGSPLERGQRADVRDAHSSPVRTLSSGESAEECTDHSKCFGNIVNNAIRSLAKLSPVASLNNLNTAIVDIDTGVSGSTQPYGRCQSHEDPSDPGCDVEECYLGILKLNPKTLETYVSGLFVHFVIIPEDPAAQQDPANYYMEPPPGMDGDVAQKLMEKVDAYRLVAQLNYGKKGMRLCRSMFEDVIIPMFRCIAQLKEGDWFLSMNGEGAYDPAAEDWGLLGVPPLSVIRSECLEDARALWDLSYNFNVPKEIVEDVAMKWFQAKFLYTIKQEALNYCTLGNSGWKRCKKLCGWCGEAKMPSMGVVKQALLSCQDSATYTDWMGRDCSWYGEFDQPKCAQYGSAETLTSCPLSCDNCQTINVVMDSFEIGTPGEKRWSVDEYNNFCKLSSNLHLRGTLVNWEDIVASMCLASEDTTGMMAEWTENLMHSSASGFFFLKMAKDEKSDLADEFQECVGSNRLELMSDVVDNPRSPIRTIISAAVSGIRSSLSPPIPFGGDSSSAKYAVRFQEDLIRTMPASITWESTLKGDRTPEPIYPECTSHNECARWRVDNNTRETWNCVPKRDIIGASLCYDYTFARRMFCAVKCYTAGCGDQADVLYNGKPVADGVGYCQPCNGCTNSSASVTSIDQSCPDYCAPPKLSKEMLKEMGITQDEEEELEAEHAVGPEMGPSAKQHMYPGTGPDPDPDTGLDTETYIEYPTDVPQGTSVATDMDKKLEFQCSNNGYMVSQCSDCDRMDCASDQCGMDQDGNCAKKCKQTTDCSDGMICGKQEVCEYDSNFPRMLTPLELRNAEQPENKSNTTMADPQDTEDVTARTTEGIPEMMEAPRRRLSCDQVKCHTETDPNAAGSFALMAWVKNMDFQYIAKKFIKLPDTAVFTNLWTRPNATSEMEWEKTRGYNEDTRELTCWTWSVDEFCYRAKWSDKFMSCKKNVKANDLKDGKWHHYSMVKRATELLDYTTRADPPRFYSLTHYEEIQFYIDGKAATEDSDRLIGWGMTDCAGATIIFFPVTQESGSIFTGGGFPYSLLKADSTSTHTLDLKIIDQIPASYVNEHFPMDKLLPLGGKDENSTITGFRFSDVDIPKGAYIRTAFLGLAGADLYANTKLEQLEQCNLRLDYAAKDAQQTVKLKVFGDRDPASFSKNARAFADKHERENCCNLAKTNTTSASTDWIIDVNEWRADVVIPGTTERVSSGFVGGAKMVDVTGIVTEISRDDNWIWGGTLTLLVSPMDRSIGDGNICDADAECANLFTTPQTSSQNGRADVATNLGAGNCLLPDGSTADYDGYWVEATNSSVCGDKLVSFKYKEQVRGAEWFEGGLEAVEAKVCRILVDSGVDPTAWTDETEITWVVGNDNAVLDPSTGGTSAGPIGSADNTTETTSPTICFRKDGETPCAAIDGKTVINVNSCRCYNPTSTKPATAAPVCARNSYCFAELVGSPKCLSHIHQAYNKAIRGTHYDECEFLYELAKPLEKNPLWVLSYNGAQGATRGFTPFLYVQWCYNADCLSPQFLNAGADALYGTIGVDPPDSEAATAKFEEMYGPFTSTSDTPEFNVQASITLNFGSESATRRLTSGASTACDVAVENIIKLAMASTLEVNPANVTIKACTQIGTGDSTESVTANAMVAVSSSSAIVTMDAILKRRSFKTKFATGFNSEVFKVATLTLPTLTVAAMVIEVLEDEFGANLSYDEMRKKNEGKCEKDSDCASLPEESKCFDGWCAPVGSDETANEVMPGPGVEDGTECGGDPNIPCAVDGSTCKLLDGSRLCESRNMLTECSCQAAKNRRLQEGDFAWKKPRTRSCAEDVDCPGSMVCQNVGGEPCLSGNLCFCASSSLRFHATLQNNVDYGHARAFEHSPEPHSTSFTKNTLPPPHATTMDSESPRPTTTEGDENQRVSASIVFGGTHIARTSMPFSLSSSLKVQKGDDVLPVRHLESLIQQQLAANQTDAYAAKASSSSSQGSLLDPDGSAPRSGQMYDLSVVSRLVATSEVQKLFYDSIKDVAALGGPSEIIASDHHDSQLTIKAYQHEVISIIPPIVFQERCPIVPCGDQIPGLSDVMLKYFQNQTKMKCDGGAYSCSFPELTRKELTNFACVDRDTVIDSRSTISNTWFDRNTTSLSNGTMVGFPEFLDMLTFSRVYRGGRMKVVSDWLDLQTTKVATINIFMSPRARSGTVLFMIWSYEGPAKMSFDYDFSSYVQMDIDTQEVWSSLNVVAILLSVLDLVLLAMQVWRKTRVRKQWFWRIGARHTPDAADLATVRENIILMTFWDWFDVALRASFIVFLVMHRNHYYSADYDLSPKEIEARQKPQLGNFEHKMYEILNLPWSDNNLTYNEKVEKFFRIVDDFLILLQHDVSLRTFAYILVLAGFFRIVVYMRIHPRMAVLYKTVQTAGDDMIHFFLVFFLLFFVLVFTAVWSFGSVLEEYEDLYVGAITQYRMIIGEFPWDIMERAPNPALFFVYLIIFGLVVFFLLLNFFLAIVVDSYALVKEQVNASVVERFVFFDVVTVFLYPFLALMKRWPGRHKLLDEILIGDLDMDNKNDEEQEDNTVVCTPQALVYCKIAGNMQQARSLMRYYLYVCPDMHVDAEEEMPELEHQIVFKRIRRLDVLQHKLMELPINESLAAKSMPKTDPGAIIKVLSTMNKRIDSMSSDIINEVQKELDYDNTKNECNGSTAMIPDHNLAKDSTNRRLGRRSSLVSRPQPTELLGAQRLLAERITMYTEGARLLSEALRRGDLVKLEDAEMEIFMVEWHLKQNFLATKPVPGNKGFKPPEGLTDEEKHDFIGRMLQE